MRSPFVFSDGLSSFTWFLSRGFSHLPGAHASSRLVSLVSLFVSLCDVVRNPLDMAGVTSIAAKRAKLYALPGTPKFWYLYLQCTLFSCVLSLSSLPPCSHLYFIPFPVSDILCIICCVFVCSFLRF